MNGDLIYLIEDDPQQQESLTELLTPHGYRVMGFLSAEAFLEGNPPLDGALVITDYRLGELTGLDLIRRLRPAFTGPIVLRSSEAMGELLESAAQAGANLCLGKHDSSERLLRAIDCLFRRYCNC